MIRYSLDTKGLVPEDGGAWVKYTEAAAELARLRTENEAYRAYVAQIAAIDPSFSGTDYARGWNAVLGIIDNIPLLLTGEEREG